MRMRRVSRPSVLALSLLVVAILVVQPVAAAGGVGGVPGPSDTQTGPDAVRGSGAETAQESASAPNASANDASFDGGVFEAERGAVVEIPIELDGSEPGARATVAVGSLGDTNYVTNVTVADEDGDGSVVLEWNTSMSGTNVSDRIFSAQGPDEVTNFAGESGPFATYVRSEAEDRGLDGVERAEVATLDPASYDLAVVANDAGADLTDFSLAGVEADDTGTVALTDRETAESDVRGVPEVVSATEVDGALRVAFDQPVVDATTDDPVEDTDGHFVVTVRPPGSGDVVRVDVNASDVTAADSGARFVVDASAHGLGDISPAADVSVRVGATAPAAATDDSYDAAPGNVTVDVSSAQLSETSGDHAARADALRVYQGQPIAFTAGSEDASVMLVNAETGLIIFDGSTGTFGREVVFESGYLDAGSTYRLTFDDGSADATERYFNVTSLRMDAVLEQDDVRFEHDEPVRLTVSGSAIRGASDVAIDVVRPTDDDADAERSERTRFDNRGEFEETYNYSTALPAGEYEVFATDVATGVEATAGEFEVAEGPDPSPGELAVEVSPTTVTANRTAEVTVTVSDAATGDPIEDATVSVSDLQRTGTTDLNGRATLSVEASEAGQYPIDVSADGYVDADTTLTVEPAEDVSSPEVPGVSQDVAGAIAGDDAGISADDVRATVRAYFANDGIVDGVTVTDSDIRTAVQYYFRNQ